MVRIYDPSIVEPKFIPQHSCHQPPPRVLIHLSSRIQTMVPRYLQMVQLHCRLRTGPKGMPLYGLKTGTSSSSHRALLSAFTNLSYLFIRKCSVSSSLSPNLRMPERPRRLMDARLCVYPTRATTSGNSSARYTMESGKFCARDISWLVDDDHLLIVTSIRQRPLRSLSLLHSHVSVINISSISC